MAAVSKTGVKHKGKVKIFLYRPLELWEVEVPRIFRQMAHKGGKIVRPTHWPSLFTEDVPGTCFC